MADNSINLIKYLFFHAGCGNPPDALGAQYTPSLPVFYTGDCINYECTPPTQYRRKPGANGQNCCMKNLMWDQTSPDVCQEIIWYVVYVDGWWRLQNRNVKTRFVEVLKTMILISGHTFICCLFPNGIARPCAAWGWAALSAPQICLQEFKQTKTMFHASWRYEEKKHLEHQSQTQTEMALVFHSRSWAASSACHHLSHHFLFLFFLLSLLMHLWTLYISLNFLTCWLSVYGKPHHLALIVYAFYWIKQ